jgi:predicted methyltransferase
MPDRISASIVALFAASVLVPVAALAQGRPEAPKSEVAQLIERALASDIRTPEERARDARERKPVQTLEFFGLQPDMNVVELFPGAGWYTKVLGPVLADRGKLHVAFGTRTVAGQLAAWHLDKVDVVEAKLESKPTDQTGIFSLTEADMPVRNADMVLTFRNYHNFSADTRGLLNAAVFRSLRPGGIYGIVDHTRRHNEPTSPETWRRSDPVQVIKEVEAAGFQFVDYSNLHYRPDDELRFDSQRESLGGYSDRFTLKFRKPAGRPGS